MTFIGVLCVLFFISQDAASFGIHWRHRRLSPSGFLTANERSSVSTLCVRAKRKIDGDELQNAFKRQKTGVATRGSFKEPSDINKERQNNFAVKVPIGREQDGIIRSQEEDEEEDEDEARRIQNENDAERIKAFEEQFDIGKEMEEFADDGTNEEQETFKVAVNMARSGERKISRVLFSSRPPTRFPGSAQGPHIVAVSLFERAVKNHLTDTSTISFQVDGNGKRGDDVAYEERLSSKLLELAGFKGVEAIKAKYKVKETGAFKPVEYKDIKENCDKLSAFAEFEANLTNQGSDLKVRRKTRQVLGVRARATARIIEMIFRLWNKRENTVYYLQKKSNEDEEAPKPTKKDQDDFAQIYQSGAKGGVEGSILSKLQNLNDEKSKDDETIHLQLRRLIDLRDAKPEDEVKKREKFIGEDGIFTSNLGDYDEIKIEACAEALRLAQFAFPNLKFEEEKLKDLFTDTS